MTEHTFSQRKELHRIAKFNNHPLLMGAKPKTDVRAYIVLGFIDLLTVAWATWVCV